MPRDRRPAWISNRVVGTGLPKLVLVSGYSGIGNYSAVHELHTVLYRRAASGATKFDEYTRDIPCGSVAQAFQSTVPQLLKRERGGTSSGSGANGAGGSGKVNIGRG